MTQTPRPKELIKALLTDEMIDQAFEACQRFKDKNVAYGNFLKIINEAVYAGFLAGFEINEENQRLWKSVSRNLHDIYSSHKFHSNNIRPQLKDFKNFQTESFDSYDHVLYLSVDEALSHIREYYKKTKRERRKSEHVYIDGYKVKTSGLKLKTFLQHGNECSCCKTKGNFFSVSKSKNLLDLKSFHLSLWGVSPEGKPVLFTHDHTLARSLGGKNVVDNTTTMCYACNNLKSAEETKLAAIHRANNKVKDVTEPDSQEIIIINIEKTVTEGKTKKKTSYMRMKYSKIF